MSGSIEPVRGMRDMLPLEYAAQAATIGRIERVLELHGYAPIDVPIIEQRDLYSRKLGEELVGKVYEFAFGGRDLVLRPEMTASVLRAYVARLQDQPAPLRLRYAGPVFRYERPQRLTYRQFTQVGVELIGAPPPRADAECIALACAGLTAAGVTQFRVRIGHIGLVRAVLAALGLTERTQGVLLWSLERMRTGDIEGLRQRLNAGSSAPFDAALLEGIDDRTAEGLLLHSLREIGVNLRFGTRPPEEIVGRLVRKLRRDDPQPRIDRAVAVLTELSGIHGPAEVAIAQAEALLAAAGLPTVALDELRTVFRLVAAHGVATERLDVDFGIGRGLHYYTGPIFEIYDAAGMQLCGGGRYDDLVTALGGRHTTPAVGFAYGIERVVAAGALPVPEPAAAILVAASDDDSHPYALEVARRLRDAGHAACVDVRQRSVAANLRDALRRDAAVLVLVGAEECARGEVVWRDLASRHERRIPLDELARGVPHA